MIAIARSPFFTAYPSRSQLLNPATNVASGLESATSSWFDSDRRASPACERTRTQRCQPLRGQQLLGRGLQPLAMPPRPVGRRAALEVSGRPAARAQARRVHLGPAGDV